MAKGIRFTKAELAAIKYALDQLITLPTKGANQMRAALESVEAKLELAEMPVRARGLTVNEALEAFRGVLGSRLLAPSWQATGILAQMKNRIAALGLTREDCVTVATAAGTEWAGVIRAESLVRQADKLLAGAKVPERKTFAPPPRNNSPVELGEEDI